MKSVVKIFITTGIFGCVFLSDSDIHCTERELLSNYGTLQLNLMKTMYPPPDHKTKFKYSNSNFGHKDLHQLRTNMEPPDPYTRFLEPGYPLIILLKNKELQGVNENNVEPANNLMKERHKRTITLPLYYRISNKYIEQIDESLTKDTGFLANLNEVFASDLNNNSAEVYKTNIQSNNNWDANSTDYSKDNNTGIDNRIFGPETMRILHENYIPTEKVNGITLTHALIPNNNEHGGTHKHDTDEHSSESTKKQDDVIAKIFGTPPPQLISITKNKSNSVTTTGPPYLNLVSDLMQDDQERTSDSTKTGYKMSTIKSKETSRVVGKNVAKAQTASLGVYFIYSILIVLLFPQL